MGSPTLLDATQLTEPHSLLLRCRYPTVSRPPQSLPGSNGALTAHSHEVADDNGSLIQGLTSAAADGQPSHGRVSSLIDTHKRHFEEMVEAFFSSYHKWVPIVHQGSFRERCNIPQTDRSRGFSSLILSMSLSTRSFMDRGKPDSLRVALYSTLKGLLWNPESIERPTLALVQSGVMLSAYEYGQGQCDAAYMTICLSLSMAQVCGLSKPCPGHHQPPLPIPGFWTPEDEALRTWWAILIHERFATYFLHLSS